jgi:hypothetical protein
VANLIYSPPSYAMGASETDTSEAEVALSSMKRSLKGWLGYRRQLDEYVAGKRPAPKIGRGPGVKPLPPSVVAVTLQRDRFNTEQDLAETIYALLVEMGCPKSSLPAPSVQADPDAAVKLATLAINGGCPADGPQAQGIVWFALAIPIGGLVLVISQYLKSKADVAKEKERVRCIESGACTDSGFWLKLAAISVLGWVAWDKMGLREALKGTFKKKSK